MKKKCYNYAIKELSANFSGTSQLHGTDEQCMELNEGGMRIFLPTMEKRLHGEINLGLRASWWFFQGAN